MSTVYTLNGKVLKNAANDKWLTKKETPAPSFDEVTIGTQTWLAKNLTINDGGSGIYVVNNVTANDVNFGTQYYYTYDAAVRVANSIQGWHLPSQTEWQTLKDYLGDNSATILKSTYGWSSDGNGTDDYGFTGLPVARYDTDTSSVSSVVGQRAFYWASTVDGTKYYYATLPYWNTLGITYDSSSRVFSVRLIKDT